jgi:hypothetical protein
MVGDGKEPEIGRNQRCPGALELSMRAIRDYAKKFHLIEDDERR